jgi:hypothetical protein
MKPFSVAVLFVVLLWTVPLEHVMAYPFVSLFVAAIIGSSWFGGAIAGSIADRRCTVHTQLNAFHR